MERYLIAKDEQGLSPDEIRQALFASLEGRSVRRALILPPDFTRFHSGAGFITNVYYHALTERGAAVDILPALGTHEPMTPAQLDAMFGDVPHERFLVHDSARSRPITSARSPRGFGPSPSTSRSTAA